MIMNKDQGKGRLRSVIGKFKEQAGKAVGSKKTQVKGTAEKTAGKMQAGYGDAKSDVEKVVKKHR